MKPEMVKDEVSQYLEQHAAFRASETFEVPTWVAEKRRAGIDSFARLGFPTVKNEEWKYTNVAPIAKQVFTRGMLDDINVALAAKSIPLYAESVGCRLVFLNGIFLAEASDVSAVPAGIRVGNLASVLTDDAPEAVRSHLARHTNIETNAFSALNTAFFHDGAFIQVAKNTLVEKPIHLFFVSGHHADFRVSHPRVLIVAERGSAATVVENYIELCDEHGRFASHPYLTTAVTEIAIEDGANLEHYKVQNEGPNAYHIADTRVELNHGSVFTGHAVAVGAKLSRNQIAAKFNADGGECNLNGLYFLADQQLAESNIRIDHSFPHCVSNVLYKGALDARSRGVFNGQVFVHENAVGTNAVQTNKNLLLSTEARMDTKPQLEIFADDVKCGHGATVGQLDNEEIFYLLSRGLPREEARTILTFGFAEEVLQKIKIDSIKAELEQIVSTRIKQQAR